MVMKLVIYSSSCLLKYKNESAMIICSSFVNMHLTLPDVSVSLRLRTCERLDVLNFFQQITCFFAKKLSVSQFLDIGPKIPNQVILNFLQSVYMSMV
jgi:hypothetical protein